MKKFSIGVYTFVPVPHNRHESLFIIHVMLGDEHLATLDICWPNDTDPSQVHRHAAHWSALEYISFLEQAVNISATGILT